MLQLRDRLHAFTDNSRWEQAVLSHATGQRPVLLFGDSQIALWPLVSFGAWPTVNRGVSGDWATRSVARFHMQFDEVMPRQTVLLIGTNDVANGRTDAEILASIEEMIGHALQHGSQVILCSILPASGEAAAGRPVERIRQLNASLQHMAASSGARFVDLYATVVDAEGGFAAELTVDGLHPSRAGYLRMTQELLPTMLPAPQTAQVMPP
jgi:lysophospholipase L1-like esterase